MAGIWLPLTWKIQQTKSLVKRAKHHQWWQALDKTFYFLCWVIKGRKKEQMCIFNAKKY